MRSRARRAEIPQKAEELERALTLTTPYGWGGGRGGTIGVGPMSGWLG